MIFDNIEEYEVLKENWPIVGRGCILVTCRSENLAAGLPANALEIPTFTVGESSDLMLKILDRQNVDEGEVDASKILSQKLGGLALALDIIAKQVRIRKKSIRDFIPYYDEHYGTLHKRPKRGIRNPYYDKDLTTVWKAAFENLSSNSAICMSLLCFVAPESVPDWLLSQKVDLDEKYSFLKEHEE